jgi:phenylalanyl-tRNA synthetase beta subunit
MPDLSPTLRTIDITSCNRLLGTSFSADEIVHILKKMRYGAEKTDEKTISVRIPCYRADIMHEWDIFEDVAIGAGFSTLNAELPATFTIGCEHPIVARLAAVREICCGLGYLEVMPFTLSNEDVMYTRMQRAPDLRALHVLHPISEEQTLVRTDLLPLLLDLLRINKRRELPQRIFHAAMWYIQAKPAKNSRWPQPILALILPRAMQPQMPSYGNWVCPIRKKKAMIQHLSLAEQLTSSLEEKRLGPLGRSIHRS